MSVIGISTLPGTANNPMVECLTLFTDYSGTKNFCTNGRNCTGKCVVAKTGTNYCLVNVKFSNISPSQFIGYRSPCGNGGSLVNF